MWGGGGAKNDFKKTCQECFFAECKLIFFCWLQSGGKHKTLVFTLPRSHSILFSKQRPNHHRDLRTKWEFVNPTALMSSPETLEPWSHKAMEDTDFGAVLYEQYKKTCYTPKNRWVKTVKRNLYNALWYIVYSLCVNWIVKLRTVLFYRFVISNSFARPSIPSFVGMLEALWSKSNLNKRQWSPVLPSLYLIFVWMVSMRGQPLLERNLQHLNHHWITECIVSLALLWALTLIPRRIWKWDTATMASKGHENIDIEIQLQHRS